MSSAAHSQGPQHGNTKAFQPQLNTHRMNEASVHRITIEKDDFWGNDEGSRSVTDTNEEKTVRVEPDDPWASTLPSGFGPIMSGANTKKALDLKRVRQQYFGSAAADVVTTHPHIPDSIRANLAAAEERYKKQKQDKIERETDAGAEL